MHSGKIPDAGAHNARCYIRASTILCHTKQDTRPDAALLPPGHLAATVRLTEVVDREC